MDPDLITIEGNTYKIIRTTQSDGRCFSASVYYGLYRQKASNTELNEFIQYNIINPILKTEETDCFKFFGWALKWVGSHNSNLDSGIESNIGKINMPKEKKNSDMLIQLDRFVERIKALQNSSIVFVKNKDYNKESIINFLNTFKNNLIDNYQTFYDFFDEEEQTMMYDYILYIT